MAEPCLAAEKSDALWSWQVPKSSICQREITTCRHRGGIRPLTVQSEPSDTRKIPEKGRRRSRDAALICVSGPDIRWRVVRAIDTRALGGATIEKGQEPRAAGRPASGPNAENAENAPSLDTTCRRRAVRKWNAFEFQKCSRMPACLVAHRLALFGEKTVSPPPMRCGPGGAELRRELLARTCCLRHRNCKCKQQETLPREIVSHSSCQSLGISQAQRNKLPSVYLRCLKPQNIKIISQIDTERSKHENP